MGPQWPRELDWAFDRGAFEALAKPEPGDWLADHHEDGQDVERFVADDTNRPARPRDTIVIQPLVMAHRAVDIATMHPSAPELVDWLARFFVLPVRIAEPLAIDRVRVGIRMNRGREQWNATDIDAVLRQHLPDDAYCCIGVTTTDLFPDASWNFVYGQASLSERVGVFSLARYDDAFFGKPPSDPMLVRRRGLGVVAHEVGHMFGMQHCVYHRCLMNGSNNQAEADRTPLHLCAVCLRKLHLAVGFDPRARYVALAGFFRSYGLVAEQSWVESRLADAPTPA